jgi:hypothetical protein
VLIDGRNFWKLHGRWLIAILIATALAAAATVFVGIPTGRWPGGGSAVGLILGTLAGAIFVFEMALVAKKTKPFRTARWLGAAQLWMKAHIWLGLFTVPLVVLHSGGRLGGTLTTVFVAVFTAVIISGIWGLFVQNVLPRLLLEAAPAETVYSQIDQVGQQYAAEARRLVLLACGDDGDAAAAEPALAAADSAIARGGSALARGGEHVRGAARQVGIQIQRSPHLASDLPRVNPSPAIQKALASDVRPYLLTGTTAGHILGSRQRNSWYFDDLRQRVAPELRTLVGQLEDLCERRRQLNLQRRLHFWLHNWLWLHLPLSVALMILLIVHIISALRFS